MIAYLIAVVLAAALLALVILRVTRQGPGCRCAYRRPCAAALVAMDIWYWLRAQWAGFELWLHWWEWRPVRAHWYRQYRRADRKAFAAEMAARDAAPIVTDAEVREEWERLAAERGTPVPDDTGLIGEWAHALTWSEDPAQAIGVGWRVPDGYQLPGGRGLMFTRTPWPTAAEPMVPVETDDAPPWDITTRQQPALDEPAYGVDRCQLDVDDAERRFAGHYPCCVHCEGFTCDQPYHGTPCDIDGCQVDAAEAERLKGLMIP